MEALNLIDTFSEFKEFKNIDREAMMHILEDVINATEADLIVEGNIPEMNI